MLPEVLMMNQVLREMDDVLKDFLETGLDLKKHLSSYFEISIDEVEERLPKGSQNLAALHPGSLNPEEATCFYEEEVGNAHLLELAAWHLGSADYIADTLRLQGMFACGQVLDFGGGIGTHALVAAAMSNVEHVWFVDLNPHNRSFVQQRADLLGVKEKISVHRDLQSTEGVTFDTLVCLDVLEHIPDPSAQLFKFLECMSPQSKAILNWYFFKGHNGEYPFHFDDPILVDKFFKTLQSNFIEVFHPLLITARAYRPL